jgi:N-acetylglutamate synthase-like GNAT family acetyltransferase
MARSLRDSSNHATQVETADITLVQERIRQYRSAGWLVPEELVRVERSMMTEFMAESQGR